jgi:5-methylcytosine-specific restriction endonuclease McrA
MPVKHSGPKKGPNRKIDQKKADDVVARARQTRSDMEKTYREQSLRIHPWVCARCGRQFTRENLHMLTVHHKDHDHNNNPPDGSNWENLCLYCHDNEHSRYLDHLAGGEVDVQTREEEKATYKPFANLADLLKGKKD